MTDAVTLELSIRRYEGFAALDPDNPHIQMKLGDLYHGAGRLDDAMKCFERCAQSEEHAATARSRMASVHLSAHRFEKAGALLETLAEKEENVAALHYNLGLARLHQGKWSEANESFTQAMNLGLNTEAIYDYRTRTQHHLGNFEDALGTGRKWIALFPTTRALGYVAMVALDAGHLDDAADLAERAAAMTGPSPFAHAVLGMIALVGNHPAVAVERFERTVTDDPGSHRGWFGLGIAQLQAMNLDGALTSLLNAAALMPDDPLTAMALELVHLATTHSSETTERMTLQHGSDEGSHSLTTDPLFNARPTSLRAALDAMPKDSDSALAIHSLLSRLNDEIEATVASTPKHTPPPI